MKSTTANSQSEKFKEAARELGCDEDEARFEANLKKVAAHKQDAQPKRSATQAGKSDAKK